MYQCIKFILFWNDTLHVSVFSPSSGFQDCTYSNRHMSNRYCRLLASKQTAVSVWQMPVALCTILNSWWWTERPSETCTVSFQNKIIWYIGASGWFYYRNILQRTAIWTWNLTEPCQDKSKIIYFCVLLKPENILLSFALGLLSECSCDTHRTTGRVQRGFVLNLIFDVAQCNREGTSKWITDAYII